MEQPERITQYSKNEDAYVAYYNASITATELRTMVLSGGAGSTQTNKKNALKKFRQQFDFLYSLTMDSDGLNAEILKEVSEWVFQKPVNSDQYILDFCDVFNRYKTDLSKKEVI